MLKFQATFRKEKYLIELIIVRVLLDNTMHSFKFTLKHQVTFIKENSRLSILFNENPTMQYCSMIVVWEQSKVKLFKNVIENYFWFEFFKGLLCSIIFLYDWQHDIMHTFKVLKFQATFVKENRDWAYFLMRNLPSTI